MKNESKTRVVRVYAQDLADRDILVTAEADYLGTIEGEPEIDWATGRVSFELHETDRTTPQTMKVNAVARIEISRGRP